MPQRKDITLTPEWPEIHFGDGTWGRIVEIKPSKNAQGVDVNVMKIIAGPMLIALYDIPEEMLDDQRQIVAEIPENMMTNISISPAFPKWWCYLDVFGRPCPGTQFLLGYIDAQKIVGFQKMMDLLKAENAWLKEGYYKAKTNRLKEFKEFSTIADMFNINISQPGTNQPQTTGPTRGDL